MNAHSAVWRRLAHLLIGLTLVLTLVSPLLSAPRVARAAGPYVVDVILDAPDANLLDGVCDDTVGDCTLRAAIQQATHDNVPTTITFATALLSSTFALDDFYGTILWAGSNITVTGGSNNITISGQNFSAGKSAFQIEGDDNLLENITVKRATQDGIQIGDFAGTGSGNRNALVNVTVFDNDAAGIYVFGGSSSGGQNNSITTGLIGAADFTACGAGNNLGVFVDQGATSTTLTGNTIICNLSHGVQISGTDSVALQGNVIGMANNLARPNAGNGVYALSTVDSFLFGNYISGNGLDGILLENSSLAHINGNNIGTNFAVSGAIPNGVHGVALTSNSHHNAIGDSLGGDRNIISGNNSSGILVAGSGTHDNTISNNYIGTNLAGTAAIANGLNGVRLLTGAHDNLIGGASASDRNVISGNSQAGVLIDGSNTNTVNANLIGLNALGNSALPNGQDGIWINNGAGGNTVGVGSSDVNQAQFIAGNVGSGVLVTNSNGNYVSVSNRIGVDLSGNAVGNGDGGVVLIASGDNTIQPTLVANNAGAGLAAIGSASTGNYLRPLHVYGNSGLPVDLENDGPTPNDGDDDTGAGANNLLEYPVITAAVGNILTGTVCAGCSVFVYQAIGNPAAAQGGGDYLQFVLPDGLGHWNTTLPVGMTRLSVTLQAYNSASSTSELSPRPVLFLPLVRR